MIKKSPSFALNCLAIVALSAALFGCNSKNEEVVVPVVEDSVLTTNVKAALAADPELKGVDFTVAAHTGVVELGGTIASYTLIDRALSVTRAVTGVKSIDDKTVKKADAASPAAAVVAPPAAEPAAAAVPAAPAK